MTKTITDIYDEAARLVKQWFPDAAKYPKEERITILSVMKMLVDLEVLRAKHQSIAFWQETGPEFSQYERLSR